MELIAPDFSGPVCIGERDKRRSKEFFRFAWRP